MEQDENYQKSMEFSLKNQELYIEQIKININNCKEMVRVHSAYLEISEQQLEHELKYLKELQEKF